MYGEYIAVAKGHGKKGFMHSDGHILSILPKLADLGLDALKPLKGRITFWGEISRQHIAPR